MDRALPSAVARLLARTAAPSPVLTGARFALEPGRGRTAVPVRSVLLANVLAVAIVTATFNFGSVTKLSKWLGWQNAFGDIYVTNPPPATPALKKNDIVLTTGLNVTFTH